MPMTFDFKQTLLKICSREDLSREEARAAFLFIMEGQASEAQIGGLLVGLVAKGTTVDELVGAAMVMREKAINVGNGDDSLILDTCGTGGDAWHVQHLDGGGDPDRGLRCAGGQAWQPFGVQQVR